MTHDMQFWSLRITILLFSVFFGFMYNSTLSQDFSVFQSLMGVYGIGSGVAEKLYSSSTYSVRSVQNLVTLWNQLNLSDERIKYGESCC